MFAIAGTTLAFTETVRLSLENHTVFRITQVNGQQHSTTTTLRVEGQLHASCLDEFARACEPYLGKPGAVRLDLAGVTFIDDAGVAAIRRLIAAKIMVSGCSPFVNELLKERSS